jgi:hypothetical protein
MSRDGRGAWLVFSGDDAFSVRQATLIPTANPAPPPDQKPLAK